MDEQVSAVGRRWSGRARFTAAAAGGAIVASSILVAGFAVAQTGGGDQFTGCLTRNGRIQSVAIGTEPAKECKDKGTQISWNETGPQGLPGAAGNDGAPGPQGEPGPAGNDGADGSSSAFHSEYEGPQIILNSEPDGQYTTIASLEIPPGNYVVTGTATVEFKSREYRTTIHCSLGNRFGGLLGSTAQSVENPGNILTKYTMALQTAGTTEETTVVTLGCWAQPDQVLPAGTELGAAFQAYITAIAVDDLSVTSFP